MKQEVILIGGMAHSGTTLLQRALKYHPEISGPIEETHFLVGTNRISIEESVATFKKKFPESKYILEKTPLHLWFFENLLRAQPNAKLLYIVRDGKDVVASLNMRSAQFPVKRMANEWASSVDKAIQLSKAFPKNLFILRYDQLVSNFDETLKNILSFLDLSIESYDFNLIRCASSLVILRSQNDSDISKETLITQPRHQLDKFGKIIHEDVIPLRQKQVNSPLYDGSGRWKSMSQEKIKLMRECDLFMNILRLLGYQLP